MYYRGCPHIKFNFVWFYSYSEHVTAYSVTVVEYLVLLYSKLIKIIIICVILISLYAML